MKVFASMQRLSFYMDQYPDNIIFIDGDCVLCNRAVLFLNKLDTADLLYYTSLSSNTSKAILPLEYTIEKKTVVFRSGLQLYFQSRAILKILETIGRASLLQFVLRYTPTCIADSIYRLVARIRNIISSQLSSCALDGTIASRVLP